MSRNNSVGSDGFVSHRRAAAAGFTPGGLDPRGMSLDEFTKHLDVGLRKQHEQSAAWDFEGLVAFLDGVAKANPHQHITGSVGNPELLRLALQIYQEDPASREAFLEYATTSDLMRPEIARHFFQLSINAMVHWLQTHIPLSSTPDDFSQADDRLNLVRLAFQSGHTGTNELLEEAYRCVALENQLHGVAEVWFRTTLGDHDAESFERATRSAIRGASRAEADGGSPLNVRFVVGMRKMWQYTASATQTGMHVDAQALGLVTMLGRLRDGDAQTAGMILGVDSVGTDTGWRPEWQAPARTMAASQGMHVAMHFGEAWRPGELPATLLRLETLVRSGDIRQLDNSNAIFAIRDTTNPVQAYSDEEWNEIGALQVSVFGQLIGRGIGLGINPTSNDWLTRSLRQREGWRLRHHNQPVTPGDASVIDMMFPEGGVEPLVMVVGNDNSRIYPSRVQNSYLTVSEELANLWEIPGSCEPSVFGKLPTRAIAQLIMNGFTLTQCVSGTGKSDDSLQQFGPLNERGMANAFPGPNGRVPG
ncbi:MAG: hypothetical protein J4N99_01085 [Chloroflexi bacterium]|nr:hypothetical protein [Chloroflexota bacterium]